MNEETKDNKRIWRLCVKNCSPMTVKRIADFIYELKRNDTITERGLLINRMFEFPCTFEDVEKIRYFLAREIQPQRIGQISFIPLSLEKED